MNIIVCVKQVIDPEAPPASFQIDAVTRQAVMQGAAPVIDPYGEFAVEAALKIRDAVGARVTVISLGAGLLRDVVKKPLAMSADALVLLEDEAFTGGDGCSTAYALARAIEKIGEYDLILCGREASDTNAGQTGPGIAELLGLPSVTLAGRIEVAGGRATVVRSTAEGYEVVDVALPAVVTVSHEIGEPRYPTVNGIVAARSVQPVVWGPADIGAAPSLVGAAGRRAKVLKLFQPAYEGRCRMAAGDTPEEAGADLAVKLREARIL